MKNILSRALISVAAVTFTMFIIAFPAQASPDDSESAAVQGQQEFGDLIGAALDRFPDAIVDFTWEADHGVIVATPDDTRAVGAFVSMRAPNVRVTESQAGVVPYLGRAAVESQVLNDLVGTGATALSAAYDPSINAVRLTSWVDNVAKISQRLIERASRGFGLAVIAEFKPSSDAPRTVAARGGESYGGGCTGGFIATRSGVAGILTAAHCTTKPTTYNGLTTGATYTANSSQGTYDLRFTALTGSVENKIRIDNSGNTRTITSVGSVAAGMTICRFGLTSGYACTQVTKYWGSVTYSDVGMTFNGLYYAASPGIVKPGDSGGPWFYNSTAYGITSGYHIVDGTPTGSLFTPAAYTGSFPVVVTIKTS